MRIRIERKKPGEIELSLGVPGTREPDKKATITDQGAEMLIALLQTALKSKAFLFEFDGE